MQVQRFDFKEFTSSSIEDLDAQPAMFRKTSLIRRKEAEQVVPPPPPPPPAPPPEPTYSEAELKAAEMKGYQRGFSEGMEDGKKQLDAEQAELQKHMLNHTENFIKAVLPLFAEYRKMCVEMKKQIPDVALAIARKVAGPALEENAQAVIQDMVLQSCESMISEPKLTITVHESMGDMLADKLEALTSRLQSNNEIIILRSPDIALSDCKVEWKNGAMERSTNSIWYKLEKAAENLAAAIERDTNEQLDQIERTLPKEEKEEVQQPEAPQPAAAAPEPLKPAAPAQPATTRVSAFQDAPKTNPVPTAAPAIQPTAAPAAPQQQAKPTTELPSDTTSPAEKKE